MFDRIVTLVTIIIALVVYFLTGFNIWIALIALVICALVSRSLKVIFQEKLDRNFPPLTVFFLSKDDLGRLSAKGMRVIVITEGLFFHTETEADRKFILDLIDEYAEKFAESNKVFKYRYNYVIKHNLPSLPAYAACRNAKAGLKAIYRRWFEESGASKFGALTDDVDNFMADTEVTDPRDGSQHRTMIQFVFDPNLPVPDENYE